MQDGFQEKGPQSGGEKEGVPMIELCSYCMEISNEADQDDIKNG